MNATWEEKAEPLPGQLRLASREAGALAALPCHFSISSRAEGQELWSHCGLHGAGRFEARRGSARSPRARCRSASAKGVDGR